MRESRGLCGAWVLFDGFDDEVCFADGGLLYCFRGGGAHRFGEEVAGAAEKNCSMEG